MRNISALVAEALQDEYAHCGSGTVANAYGYPAIQTVAITARRTDGAVAVAIGTTNAKSGACPRPYTVPIPRLRPDSPAVRKSVREWADNPVGGFVLTAEETTEILEVG
jgi:hypothetical protein